MNILKFKYLFSFLFLAVLITSCSESDKVFDEITDNVQRGAILRSIDVMSNSVAINSGTLQINDGEQFAALLEYQDDEDGALLSAMNVYISYADNTDDGVDNSKGEVLYEAVPASSFSTGDRGLPQILYSVSGQQMQSAVGLTSEQIGLGGDAFAVRFELLLTDGRTFSNFDNSGTITGSYFNSPFQYLVNLVCAPSLPTSGIWVFDTIDSWGDGWNGASLEVVVDGVNIASVANEYGGPNEQTFEVEVPAGSQTISIMFVSGSFDGEIEYTITSANGNVVATGGPGPPAGVELLDYCADNL